MDIFVLVSQIISVIILIYLIIADIDLTFMKRPIPQFAAAVIILAILLFVDPFAGFVLACAAFVIYYKVFIKIKQIDHKQKEASSSNHPYITQSQLNDVQSNIYDKGLYDKDIDRSLTGYNEASGPLYSIQGLNNNMPGYDTSSVYHPI